MKKNILPIIVVYQCQLEDAVAYQTLVKASGITEFVVYDNSPSGYCQQAGMIPPTAHYYHDTENGGLSKAYNYGVGLAQQLGYEWVLLLDQDTEFPEGAWTTYEASTTHRMLLVPNVVLKQGQPFSPSRSRWSGMSPLQLAPGEYSLHDYTAINSGCCLPVDLYQKAGGYKEDVRLDFSDYQFQRRLRKVADRFYVMPLVALQDFSNDEVDVQKLQRRFDLYLDCARHCETDRWTERLALHLSVLKHSVALSVRTRKACFIVSFIRKYL